MENQVDRALAKPGATEGPEMQSDQDLEVHEAKAERGASLVEYVLLLAMIAIVCIAALTYFGSQSSNNLGHSCHMILTAGGGNPSPGC
jgi:Flp pilus assembly pilin Flp